jgi:hypothetical protein
LQLVTIFEIFQTQLRFALWHVNYMNILLYQQQRQLQQRRGQ